MGIEGREKPEPWGDPNEEDVSPDEKVRRADVAARLARERLSAAEERLRLSDQALRAEEEKTNAEIDARFGSRIEEAEEKARALRGQAELSRRIEDWLDRRTKRRG